MVQRAKKIIRTTSVLLLAMQMMASLFLPAAAEETKEYSITLKQTEHGTISCDQTQAAKSDIVTVKAVPEEGYRLAFLFFDDETKLLFHQTNSNGENEYSGYMPDRDSVITAMFVPEDQFGILVRRKDMEGGSVKLSKECGSLNDEITVTVQTNEGYTLNNVQVEEARAIYGIGAQSKGVYRFQLHDSDVKINVYFMKNVKNYTDVKKDSWYEGAVIYLTNRGILSGVSETEFAPNGKVTRAQLCQTLYAIEGKPEVIKESSFSDVHEGKWYSDAVNWCAEEGYVSGYPDKTFRPDQIITREQIAVILYQFNKDVEYQPTHVEEYDWSELYQYTDGKTTSAYAKDAMEWALETGLFSGTGNGTLEPKGPVTRAQLAVILAQFIPKPMGD